MNDQALKLIRKAREELERSKVPFAARSAEELFMHSFGVKREDIYGMDVFRPRMEKIQHFKRRVKLRASRIPIEYILKSAEFMAETFFLDNGVFIPRPETELLVEKVLEAIRPAGARRVNILEIGTGCGNIAISLTKKASRCKIIASDVSDKALKVAAKNSRAHGTKKRIKFIKSSFFDGLSHIYYNYFDIIVSNPPYVRRAEIKDLQPEIAFEDKRALDGGEDGLRAYRRILGEGVKYLKKGGIFAFEIGYDQSAAVRRLIEKDGRFFGTKFFKDYGGHHRIVTTGYGRGAEKIG